MRLKSFTADTMRQAMDMVRDALGEEAIIVATREEKGANGKTQVQLTAAIEKDTASDIAQGDASESWLYEDDSDEAQVVEFLTDNLLGHGVPEDILDQVISYASVMDHTEPRLALLSTIENLFKFANLPTAPEKKPLIMVGPPGAGKTLAVAKVAARSVMSGLNVSVITTDTQRAGGQEQLEAFTNLMETELHLAATPQNLKTLLDSPEILDSDQIIIDTAGANPFDSDHIKQLARFISAGTIEPILVMPTGYDAGEAGDIARIFASLGAKKLLSTRIDVARRLGSLLSAAHYGNMTLTDIGTSAKVAGGLSPLDAKRLTQLLMPRANMAAAQKVKEAEKASMDKSQIKDSQRRTTSPIMEGKSDDSLAVPEFIKSITQATG
ncbi:MAG: GTPase [Alphaproteobacteria bacterium]|nr:GTPase [Alphaproteobacteria bacterium]